MSDLLARAEALWNGTVDVGSVNPVAAPTGDFAEVGDGTGFVHSFANVTTFHTSDGIVMVDAGAPFVVESIHQAVRAWRPDRLDTCVYTHGHIDHVFAVPVFEAEAEAEGWAPPRVVAHEAVPERFDRYKLTAGYNAVINQRQFGAAHLQWPTDYRYPDETYRDDLAVEVGGERFDLHHDRGETDDHTWLYAPDRKVLCTGDLFIWCVPNAGNPQKVPRYARDWAIALREMATVGAEVLLPGHGVPIIGADRVRAALSDTAELLESLTEQTLRLMNEGARLNDILHAVRPPAHLVEKPYLRPVYDDPEFIVRNLWRLYGGWYDGNPAELKPAPTSALAAEVASLAGGVAILAKRALELAGSGDATDLRLAGHLAQLAVDAEPASPEAHAARAEVFERRVAAETSLMAKGVFSATVRDSRAQSPGNQTSG